MQPPTIKIARSEFTCIQPPHRLHWNWRVGGMKRSVAVSTRASQCGHFPIICIEAALPMTSNDLVERPHTDRYAARDAAHADERPARTRC